MKALGLVAACAALVTLAGCTTFPVIDSGECGNAVVEPGEDCDTFVPRDLKGSVCRPKGVPGEECHFDCRTSADGTRGVCPDGLGCAADGVCRHPTGNFQLPASKFSSQVASWVSSADFDGDGRLEVIAAEPVDQAQQARFSLHYFDADAKLVETRTFPHATTRPVARRLDGDSLSDLVFSTFRVGVLPGRKDRDWVPATFSSYTVQDSFLRMLPVSQSLVGNVLPLLAFTTIDGVLGIYVPDKSTLALHEKLPRSPRDLIGSPLAADIVEGRDSPCLEAVFAFRGDDFFHLLDSCMVGANVRDGELVWREEPRDQIVHLADGALIDAAPISADVDGDGHLDILVGSQGQSYVSHGDGTRLEATATPFSIQVLGNDGPQAYPLPMPLAAGDITGDELADYVLPMGVLGSRRSLIDSSTEYFTCYFNSAEPWSIAQVLDLNGNDLLDVIAATDRAPGVTFLNGSGGPFPVPQRLASQGPVRLLGTGDFDGDQLMDVAFVEEGPGRSSKDSLAIAFGTRDSAPTEPARIAEASGIEQLGSFRDEPVDDVFTASSQQVHGVPRASFTIFGGDADRLPFAPYTLATFSTDGNFLDSGAPALMVGAFSAPGSHDVLALGTSDYRQGWKQWLIPDIGGGVEPPRLLAGDPPEGVLPYSADHNGVRVSVASIAADLDGDGLDEALWLMPRHPDDKSSFCSLLIYDVDPDANRVNLKERLDFDQPCVTPELVAAPLSDDPELQLLLLMGDPAQGPRQLEILWNDHHGNFSVDDHSFVHDRNNGDVRAFSLFPRRDGTRLAFVTASALHIASTRRDSHEFDAVDDVDAVFDDVRGVAVGDPNGDTIDDLVVADAEGLWLLQAELR